MSARKAKTQDCANMSLGGKFHQKGVKLLSNFVDQRKSPK